MAISFAHNGILFIVLDEENVERIQAYDPFEFNGSKVPVPIALAIPLRVVVAYARKDEMAHLEQLQATPDELVEYLGRGYKVTASDHDRGYDVYNSLRDTKRH